MTDDRDERGDSTEGLGADADASAGFAHSKEATEIIPEPVAVALAREIKRLTTVAEILRGWIWETDENHRFTYLSDSIQRFAGRSPEWHYGKTRKELGNLSADHEKNKIYLGQLERREKFGPF